MLMIGRLSMLEHRMTKVAVERGAHCLDEGEMHFELTQTLELKAEARESAFFRSLVNLNRRLIDLETRYSS